MNSKSPIFTAQSDVALRIHVDRAVRHYFAQLQGEQPSQVYDMVLAEMEKPLLSVVLEYTRGNQTRAAEILGLNRGTLRKKLKAHGLIRGSLQHVSDYHVYILILQIKEVSPFLLAPCRKPEMAAHLAIVQNNGELRDLREYEERHQIVQ